MNKYQTVFIIGAGASIPFGLPSGLQLKQTIVSASSESSDLYPHVPLNKLSAHTKHISRMAEEFCEALYRSGRPSVDAFLENRPEYIDIGKKYIASKLLPLEFEAAAKPPNEWDYTGWIFTNYYKSKIDMANSKIAFIVFNYDRIVESALLQQCQHSFGVPEDEAKALVSRIPIIHPYGKLIGPHSEWLDNSAIQLGHKTAYWTNPEIIKTAADGIQLITQERSIEQSTFKQANEFLMSTNRIVFLGFGFDATNLQRLGFPLSSTTNPWIIGSCYKMLLAQRKTASNMLRRTNPLPSNRYACLDFLNEFVEP